MPVILSEAKNLEGQKFLRKVFKYGSINVTLSRVFEK